MARKEAKLWRRNKGDDISRFDPLSPKVIKSRAARAARALF
jgi:hypothetical protein